MSTWASLVPASVRLIAGWAAIVYGLTVLSIASWNAITHSPGAYLPGLQIQGVQLVSMTWPVWPIGFALAGVGVLVILMTERHKQ